MTAARLAAAGRVGRGPGENQEAIGYPGDQIRRVTPFPNAEDGKSAVREGGGCAHMAWPNAHPPGSQPGELKSAVAGFCSEPPVCPPSRLDHCRPTKPALFPEELAGRDNRAALQGNRKVDRQDGFKGCSRRLWNQSDPG